MSEKEIKIFDEAPIQETERLTEKELDPANWQIQYMETDCGYPCTPNGCCGHSTDIPEALAIGGYIFSFPVDDLTDNNDWNNATDIGRKLREVIDFYVKNHKDL